MDHMLQVCDSQENRKNPGYRTVCASNITITWTYKTVVYRGCCKCTPDFLQGLDSQNEYDTIHACTQPMKIKLNVQSGTCTVIVELTATAYYSKKRVL